MKTKQFFTASAVAFITLGIFAGVISCNKTKNESTTQIESVKRTRSLLSSSPKPISGSPTNCLVFTKHSGIPNYAYGFNFAINPSISYISNNDLYVRWEFSNAPAGQYWQLTSNPFGYYNSPSLSSKSSGNNIYFKWVPKNQGSSAYRINNLGTGTIITAICP